MRCESLRYFQDELEAATHAVRSVKGPIWIREITVLNMRLKLAHETLLQHRSTCLICANAPIEAYVIRLFTISSVKHLRRDSIPHGRTILALKNR